MAQSVLLSNKSAQNWAWARMQLNLNILCAYKDNKKVDHRENIL